ncbi:MAG TPA: DUF4112 domain-containing protein [Oscillatoriaceae cyanobacterium M33_DOE_052]|uniref:DUF4112 domain-containing protein n=1 Tax=Planktothricoides sp. SpSt-374 TaxID=2282167 RepID=A0A7C3ZLR7_9CYAN|nr:DUF4112 domain-containing protein [Oscillatoriaceae cyanobacterium M33_DOE_052]
MNLEKNAKTATTLKRLRTLAHILDNAIPIPGTPYRIGIDPILGLIPGGGDIAGAILSAYIVFSAGMLGAPKDSLVQMLLNIVLESVVGTVPVVGDLFDATWKANVKNLELLETHLQATPTDATRGETLSTPAPKWFIWAVVAVVVLVALAIALAGIAIITLVVNLLFRGG